MSLNDAWASSRSIVVVGGLGIAFTVMFAPDLIWWLLPIAVPMLIAPFLICGTSQNAEHGLLGRLFRTPTEIKATPVMAARDEIFARWQETAPETILLSLGVVEPQSATAPVREEAGA
jgi:membrane glycosyltransferase